MDAMNLRLCSGARSFVVRILERSSAWDRRCPPAELKQRNLLELCTMDFIVEDNSLTQPRLIAIEK